MATLTQKLPDTLKKALDTFCDAHGLKQQHVVQQAIASWLEDAQDIECIDTHRDGPWDNWEDVRDAL